MALGLFRETIIKPASSNSFNNGGAMQPKGNSSKVNMMPVRREIPTAAIPATKAPGEIGKAAAEAAARRQLDQCAKEIESFVEASQMERVIENILEELNTSHPQERKGPRLCRE
jgi:hypothetical protein